MRRENAESGFLVDTEQAHADLYRVGHGIFVRPGPFADVVLQANTVFGPSCRVVNGIVMSTLRPLMLSLPATS
jgi:hypothetical protein